MDILAIAMFVTLLVALLSGMPVAFAIGGVALLFGVIGELAGAFAFTKFYAIALRMYGGSMSNLVMVAVPLFIFMGVVLEQSRIAEDLLATLNRLMTRVPGGLAVGVTAIATLMAATTGIIGASVVMMTMIAMPAMLRRGYSPVLASGTIAASGTLGILIPPSIMLVFLGEMLTISVGTLFSAAFIAGLMLSGLYVVYVVVISVVRPELAGGGKDSDERSEEELIVDPRPIQLAMSFVAPTSLIVLVLGSIVAGWATPTEASGIGAAGALLIAACRGALHRKVLREIVSRSLTTTGMLFAIFLAATSFSFVFRSLGGDGLVASAFEFAGFGTWGSLVAILVLVFLLGFFFDWIEICLVAVPIFLPILSQLSFGDHLPAHQVLVWFTILLSLTLQTSFLTPPFGFALFFLKGSAPPEVQLSQIYIGIIPFVLLQVLMVVLVAIFPSIALWLPEQLSL